MKIRNKIAISFLSIVIIGGIISFLAVNLLAKNIIKEEIGENSALLARTTSDSIDRIIYRQLERWESYVNSNQDLQVFLKASNSGFDNMESAEEYIKNQDDAWKNSGKDEITEFMKSIMSNQISDGLRLRIKFYNDKYGFEVFPELFITNKYGANIAQTQKTSDYYQADEEWWQKAKSEGIWVSNLIYDESSKINGLEMAIRIENEDKDFIGALKIVYNIEEIYKTLEEINRSDSADGDGGSHEAHESMVIKLLSKDNEAIYCTKEGFKNFKDIQQELANKLISEGAHQHFVLEDEFGVEKLYGFSSSDGYKDFRGLGWTVVISHDTKEIFQPIQKMNYSIFVVFVALLMFVLLFSFIISGMITKSIVKLHHGTEIIEAGNLNYKVGTATKDEVGQLSRSFDKMVVSLKNSRSDVDKKIEEQTKDLRIKTKDLDDQKIAILNILEDVEEEKNKTELEKNKVDAVLHSIGDGVFVVDKNLQVILVNEVAAKMAGYEMKDILNKKYTDTFKFLFEDNKKVNDKFIVDAIKTKKIQEMSNHTMLVDKNNNAIQVADSSAPLLDDKKNVIGCVVVFRDVTKERDIDKAKTEFVSLASHQLRTPLSAINWYAEMLMAGDAGPLNQEQSDYLKEIYKGNQRMVDLVNSLLNVSRLELGTFVVEPKAVDIRTIADSMIKELEPQVAAKKIVLTKKYDDSISPIMLDEKLTAMIFQNLLSNAVKYTPEKGQVNLTMKKGKENLEIEVLDTGMGIPKSQQGKIFEKLFRADNVRQTDTEGTGLGLYIVKSILDNAGGRISFKSVENKGTTFYVSLPLSGMKKKEGTKIIS